MSSFEDVKQKEEPKKKADWGMEEDDDSGSDEEPEKVETAQKADRGIEEASDSDSDSESDADIDNLNITHAPEVRKRMEKKTDLSKLSKQERKELKQKELNDLDALLGEFGVKSEDPVETDASAAVSIAGESKNQKKKAKKAASATAAPMPDDEVPINTVVGASVASPAEIAALLKAKMAAAAAKKAGGAKKSSTADAQATALALTKSGGKKGKKDTKTFSEYSY